MNQPIPAKNPGGRPLRFPKLRTIEVSESFTVTGITTKRLAPMLSAYGKRHDKQFSYRAGKHGRITIWRIK